MKVEIIQCDQCKQIEECALPNRTSLLYANIEWKSTNEVFPAVKLIKCDRCSSENTLDHLVRIAVDRPPLAQWDASDAVNSGGEVNSVGMCRTLEQHQDLALQVVK